MSDERRPLERSTAVRSWNQLKTGSVPHASLQCRDVCDTFTITDTWYTGTAETKRQRSEIRGV